MVKKYTLTVSDELAKKIEKWRHKLQLSTIFRSAVGKEIQRKEDFITRMKGDDTMNTTIERLKKEKMELENNLHDTGKTDGLAWAKAASYADLLYAANCINERTSFLNGEVEVSDLFEDNVLGNYFQERVDDDPVMTPESYADALNDAATQWLTGWKQGVEEFWDHVKDKLQ